MTPEQIRKLRIWRNGNIIVAVIEAALAVFLGLTWGLAAIIPGAITVIYTAVIMRQTRKIHVAQADQARTDWTRIRMMEYEIWGRAFHHDGAPGISGMPVREGAARQDSIRDSRAVWCDCRGTLPGHIRAPEHYDPRYGYPPAGAPVINSPEP